MRDLHSRSGCPLDAEQCGPLAACSEEELLQEAAFLSRKCGDISTHQLLSAMAAQSKALKAQPDGQPSIIAARAQDFTALEHLWIIFAAAYASGDQPDMAADCPRAIGEQVGFVGRTVQMIQEFASSKFGADYAVPGLLAACSSALSVYAAMNGMNWIYALHNQLAALSFLAADSVIPTIVCALTIYAGATLWACAIGAAVISLVFIAVNACNDIEEHMNRRNARASGVLQAAPVAAAPLPAQAPIVQVEDPYGLEETDEGESENHY